MRAAVLALLLCLAAVGAGAVNPREMLKDPALEARAREISKDLRCLVCQNQSIDDSDADLARDLRKLVRERLAAGDDDRAVVDYVVSRYGDFVLLTPPFKGATYALWLGPAAIALAGLLVLAAVYHRHRPGPGTPKAGAAPLTAEEKRRLKTLLGDGEP